jgi:hypothetical protein
MDQATYAIAGVLIAAALLGLLRGWWLSRQPRRYPVIDMLTDEQKQRVLDQSWVLAPNGALRTFQPGDHWNHWNCPLGVALSSDPECCRLTVPGAITVADRLGWQGHDWASAIWSANEFITDNDNGRIRPEEIPALFKLGERRGTP